VAAISVVLSGRFITAFLLFPWQIPHQAGVVLPVMRLARLSIEVIVGGMYAISTSNTIC
jgi:hypothetical protein